MISCPNNLVDTIKDEVAVVITPPSIISIYPESDAQSIPVDMDDILITFTKQIDSSSVNNSTFITKAVNGNKVSGTYSISNDTVAFNPSAKLAYSTTYTVTVKSAILDIDGNPMTNEFSWEFTTEEAPPGEIPAIDYFRINYGKSATNSSNIILDISANNVVGVNSSMEFRYREIGNVDWSSWLPLTDGFGTVYGTVLDVTSGVPETYEFEAEVRNTAGNKSLISTDNIYFEEEAPSVLATTPEEDSDTYPSNGGIVSITFSEPMDPNTISTGVGGSFYLMDGSTRINGVSVLYIENDPNNIYPDNTALLTGLELGQGVGYVAFLEASAKDVAGNVLENDYSWFFKAGDAIDNEPPVGTIFLDTVGFPGLHPTETASNTVTANLLLNAYDIYNGPTPYGMKIWGNNNDVALPAFEADASWEAYSTTKTWTLSPGDGYKYIYYKFMDAAANETETPLRLKISLDATSPTISAVIIDGGSVYNNSQIREALISVDALDATSGLSEMKISVDGVLDSEPWENWKPSKSITLPAGDGIKTVIVQVRDYVNLTSATQSDTILLDLTEPAISFDQLDSLEVNTGTLQTGTYNDNYAIASYSWEFESGPGNIVFDDSEIEIPFVSADSDGSYVIRVTITDDAGNTSFGTVPFVWDTTAPGTPAGTAPVVNTDAYYSTLNQPTWNWTALDGADSYRVSFAASPDWDTPDASGQSGYIETALPTFAPSTGLSSGESILKVTGYDNAGNFTASGEDVIFVDTVFPFVENDGSFYLRNDIFNIDNTGAVLDYESGLDLSSIQWNGTPDTGTGIVNFSNSNSLNTFVSITGDDDTYTITLDVSDNAGNISTAYYTLSWDTTAPSAPGVSGIAHTPNTTPTWLWNSNGGGNGTYRYQLEYESGGIVSGYAYSQTTLTSFTPSGSLANNNYRLYVQERDEAGNWSSSGSYLTWVDTTFTSEPNVVRDGLYLRNASDTDVSWDWSSGAGFDISNDYYRYRLDGSGWIYTANNSVELASLAHGVHNFEVEEQNTSTTNWIGLIASSSVQIDSVNPIAPPVTGNDPTNDTTPTFNWSSGSADGIGIYMYRFYNGSSWSTWSSETTASSYTYSTILPDTTVCTLQVMEKDQAGNWSSSGSKNITIDTTAPVPTSILIDGGAAYSGDINVALIISSTGSPNQMRFYNNGWTSWEVYNTSKNIAVPSGDGSKTVYVQLMDIAGNISSYINDSIVLDTTSPVINSFKINNGGISTTSTYTTLNSSITDITPVTMYVRNGASGGYAAYTYSSARSWYLTSGYGTKRVEVYFVDSVGNTTFGTLTSDMIFYGQPNLYNTTKGDTSTGSITINYDAYASEYGTNTYHIYTSISPTGTKTERASTTATSRTLALPSGVLYYVFVNVSNSYADDTTTSTIDEGESDRFSNYMIAYSSHMAVVYNDDNTDDTNLAGQIRTLLEWTTFPASYSAVSGTIPDWEVTLVPEDEVSGSFTTLDDRYIIYGDPVIITPGTTLYTSSNKTRNIVHRSSNTGGDLPVTSSGRAGVFAMGYGGSRLLDTVETYWSSWGYPTSGLIDSTQYPTQIGYGESASFSSDPVFMYQWTSGNSTWSSPLSSTSFVGGTSPAHNVNVQISYTNQIRYSVYNSTGTNPVNGYIYGKDPYSTGTYYTVVRQGRFLQFGFNWLTDRPYTGKVYFINLIARMDNY